MANRRHLRVVRDDPRALSATESAGTTELVFSGPCHGCELDINDCVDRFQAGRGWCCDACDGWNNAHLSRMQIWSQ